MRGEDKIRVMRVECLKKSGCVKKSKENYINKYWSKNICYICALTPRHKPIVWADFPHWCWPCPSKSHRPPKENPNIGHKKASFELLFSLSKSLPKYCRYCCCMWFFFQRWKVEVPITGNTAYFSSWVLSTLT